MRLIESRLLFKSARGITVSARDFRFTEREFETSPVWRRRYFFSFSLFLLAVPSTGSMVRYVAAEARASFCDVHFYHCLTLHHTSFAQNVLYVHACIDDISAGNK